MKLLKLFRSETARLMAVGFVVGAIGLAVAQPGMAHDNAAEAPAAVSTNFTN